MAWGFQCSYTRGLHSKTVGYNCCREVQKLLEGAQKRGKPAHKQENFLTFSPLQVDGPAEGKRVVWQLSECGKARKGFDLQVPISPLWDLVGWSFLESDFFSDSLPDSIYFDFLAAGFWGTNILVVEFQVRGYKLTPNALNFVVNTVLYYYFVYYEI